MTFLKELRQSELLHGLIISGMNFRACNYSRSEIRQLTFELGNHFVMIIVRMSWLSLCSRNSTGESSSGGWFNVREPRSQRLSDYCYEIVRR